MHFQVKILANGENIYNVLNRHEDWRHELAPGVYVWTDNSTATKISILHGMFEECNIPASELVFEFRSLVQEGDCEE